VYRVLLALGLAVALATCVVGMIVYRSASPLEPQRAGGIVTLTLAFVGPALAASGALSSRHSLTASGIGVLMATLAIASMGAVLALSIFVASG
jgi:hypothetical protein